MKKFYLSFFTMKKVFFISILALACMVCTTSCSDDDEKGGEALTGLNVAPQTFKGAVGAVQKVTVTAVPTGADLGTLSWTSSVASVATVDQTGIITIVGVGTTDVTVTSGTISKVIPVEGTINGLTVADEDGNTAGTYPYNGTPITVNLTATIAPPNSGKTPVWSSSAATATVTAAANGLTAEVTIIGEGTAVITADVDGVTATYTISTESVFETAVGYWTFDDLTNLGAATRGGIDLVVDNELVTAVNGPVDGNGAVRGSLERKVDGDNGYGFDNVGLDLTWNHPMTGQVDNKIRSFSMLLDVKVLHQDPSVPTSTARNIWDPIYWNGQEDSPQAGLYIAWEDRGGTNIKISANLTGGWDGLLIDDSFDAATIAGNEPWIRFVFSVEPDVEDPERVIVKYYVNGQVAPTASAAWSAWGINEIVQGSPVYFMTKRKHDKEVKGQYDLSTLAVWDHVLTPEDIASLGGVSK
jgi:hypothetical protein